MFREEVTAAANGAAGKVNLLKKNPAGYFGLSMLAGVYIGFGTLLIFTIGSMLNGFAGAKIVMGAAFGIALSLVVIAGAELFTGNNMVMAMGAARKSISWGDAIKLWVVCYLGNLAGSILLAVLFNLGGLGQGEVGVFIAKAAAGKMALGPIELIIRGILCNMLVCLAVWSGFRCKSDSGKLIMIFWCLFAFIITGYEHSIANMTLLTAGLLNPAGEAVTVGGMVYNLATVTAGNMIGGILCIAGPYLLASKE